MTTTDKMYPADPALSQIDRLIDTCATGTLDPKEMERELFLLRAEVVALAKRLAKRLASGGKP